jgi:predicted aspartyl protease
MQPDFRRLSRISLVFVLALVLASPGLAQASFDVFPQAQSNYLPGTFVVLANPASGSNYLANINDDFFGQQQGWSYAAVLDTGASGSVISALEAQSRGLPTTGQTYSDVGIGGTEIFNVSSSTTVKLAAVDSGAVVISPDGSSVTENVNMFNSYGDYKLQIRQSDPIMESISKVAINIVGTPVLNNNVMHVRSAANPFSYYLDSFGLAPVNYVPTDVVAKSSLPGNLNAGNSQLVLVPKQGGVASTMHVPLVYKDFIDYNLNPNPGPSVSTNPTIPNVAISLGTKSISSDWLFDSGASVTMMGRDLASSLGIDLNQQGVTFTTVMGIGGQMRTFQGYEIDQLDLSTTSGGPVTFHNVVVFVPGVGDLPANLPGIFGMNLLNNSFSSLTGDLFGGITENDPVSSAFSDWYVVPPTAVPEPATIGLLAVAALALLAYRRSGRRSG